MKRNIIWLLGAIVIFGIYMILVRSNSVICKAILAIIHGGCMGYIISKFAYKFANWITDTQKQ